MKLLLDTNILLEVLLGQARAEEAKTLLSNAAGHDLFLSDFSLHSLGVVLFRKNSTKVFRQFVTEMLLDGGLMLVPLAAEDMEALVATAQKHKLDFDDAYQYLLAEKHNLTLVSFDTDFDRATRGRKTPAQIL